MGLIYRGEYSDPGKVEFEFEAMDSAITTLTAGLASAEDGYMDVTVAGVSATLTATDAGVVWTNKGATESVFFQLPSAEAGMVFNFYANNATHDLYIRAYNGDTMRLASNVTAAAGTISSAVVGSYVSLLAVNATEWVAISVVGSWTF